MTATEDQPIPSDEAHPSGGDRVPVVGVGASAGGLRALARFFDHLPADTGMAFVVIVHLDPDHESQMAELLQVHTSMPVAQPSRSVKVEPDHIYIIPPDKDLTLSADRLLVSARKRGDRPRAPIDLFFRTLAETHDTDSVGIILSGTGSDGTQGIRWIKERGGVTMAQEPADAEHDGMPRSAIATRQVDVVRPVADLAAELARIRNVASSTHLPLAEERLGERDVATLGSVFSHMRAKTGHDFAGYKRGTVLRRLRRRMQFSGSANLADYLQRLHADADESSLLFNDLLITVTSFFRDPKSFEALESTVISSLFAQKRAEDNLRVWVPGCATGEEAYSIAMLLCEHEEHFEQPPPIQIFATDAHEQAFSFARDGLYAESIAADVSRARLERFFQKEAGGYRVKKTIRERVTFASHDLLRDPPFVKLDLISCRNLLIYLQRDAQRRVMEVFHYALQPHGYLFLGNSESADVASDLFEAADKKHRIYRSLAVPKTIAAQPVATEFDNPGSPPSGTVLLGPAGSSGALHRQLLEAYAPPSVLVNAEEEVVHLSDRAGRYLQLGGGEPSRKLVEIARDDLRLTLSRLLHVTLFQGKPGEARGIRVDLDGQKKLVDVFVRPIDGDANTRFALVIFDERQERQTAQLTDPALATAESLRASDLDQLKQELSETKAQLRSTIEEHEATVEELKAANEELQSINEEQRATSEELETSKEELQSINEELRAINQEQQIKNEELRLLNSDLRNLMDSTEIGTIFLDRDFRIRRYTPPIAEIFNFVASDLGRPITDVTHLLDYPGLAADARTVLRTLTRIERDVSANDGRWFNVVISPYRSVDDRIDGTVLTFVDTTDRKHLDLERESLLADARKGSSAKSDFIGAMSHELRTPLNAIVGYVDLLSSAVSGPVTAEQLRHLGRIKVSSIHLTQMIEQILAFSRVAAGKEDVFYERLDLTQLLGEVISLVQPLADAKKIPILTDFPPDLPAVISDAVKLRQIVLNLLSNAVRYADQGNIRVGVRAEAETILIEVADTGLGIAPADLQRIFDRFWQVDQSKTRARGGSGLGLTVCRSLARLMGGDIEVESELGRGSLFRVRLPLVEGHDPL